jgi:hypothetical protein
MADEKRLIAPYLEWAILTDFAYLEGPWFHVLLEIDGPASTFAKDAEDSGFAELIRVPSIYQTPPFGFGDADLNFCTAIMTRDGLGLLLKGDGDPKFSAQFAKLTRSIKRIELGTSMQEPFLPSRAETIENLSATAPEAVIVAVIDDGLAFANERFRRDHGTKTRFKYFWNQDDTTGMGTKPAGFGWGRELPESEINSLLTSCTHSGLVDEDELYASAGQLLAARRVKHGTHVMDVACGLDPKDVKNSSPYLIGVQLPKWVTEDISGATLTPVVTDAMAYILNRADLIAQASGTAQLPIVVNISYGTIAGPHDGSGQFEIALDQLAAGRPTPLRVVLPAGNHFVARCHAKFDMHKHNTPHSSERRLRWRVQPDDKACSFLEIWLPRYAADNTRPRVSVRLTSPTGETTPWVQPGHRFPPPLTPNARFLVENLDPAGERPRIVLSLSPTADFAVPPLTAPSGTWLLDLNYEGAKITVEAWVQRGDTPFGYPLWGRQSRFDDGHYRRFDLAGRPWQDDTDPSYIRRFGSVNALATGQYPVVVGGFRRRDHLASEYTGAGPVTTPATASPPRTGPDASAVADDSAALGGILAAGTRSGSAVVMRGSSVAAPQLTRMIANRMAGGLPSDRAAVQVFAAYNDPTPPPPGSPLEERVGKGRIERPEPVEIRQRGW